MIKVVIQTLTSMIHITCDKYEYSKKLEQIEFTNIKSNTILYASKGTEDIQYVTALNTINTNNVVHITVIVNNPPTP